MSAGDGGWDLSPGGVTAPTHAAGEPGQVGATPPLTPTDAFARLSTGELPSSALFGTTPAAGPGTAAAAAPSSTPSVVLAAATLSVAFALVLVLSASGEDPTRSVLAWVMSGFVTIGLLSAHAIVDSRQRACSSYVGRRWPQVLALVVAVSATVAVVLSALQFALYAGRTW